MINPNEIWQVEVNDQIYEANVEELCQWIVEGALLPADKVRRGNLRWLEAKKVPLLGQFFNAKENDLPFPVLPTVTDASGGNSQPANLPNINHTDSPLGTENFSVENQFLNSPAANISSPDSCHIHAGETPKYICETCTNRFCKTCPQSFGASVRICPLCGAMCQSIADVNAKEQKQFNYQRAATEGFGLADFSHALAYPFRFKSSLIFGAVLYMLFTLGQSAGALGSMALGAGAIVCALLANALVFACLANTIDNFAQGKTEADFMPRFDDFSLWDDVVHPFFLSLGVYLVSFGVMIALVIGAIYYAMKSFTQIETEKEKIVSTVLPNAQNEYGAAKQIPQINEIQKQLNEQNKWKNGEMPDEKALADLSQKNAADEDARFQKLDEMIEQNRQAQLESIAGKSPEAERKSFNEMARSFLRLSMVFAIPIFLAFLWGVFYFPAACLVAGYTRSFTAVINPAIGLDTIRRMNFNYAKILLMSLVLGIFSFAVGGASAALFAPFEMPRVGNLPANAVGGLFTFYFSIVFAVVLGSAVFKSADRLNLYRG